MKKPRIFWREDRISALDAAARREAGLRDGSLARGSASAAAHFAQNIGHLHSQRADEVAALRLQRSVQGDLARRERLAGSRDQGSGDAAAGKRRARLDDRDAQRAYDEGYHEARGPYIRDWRERQQAGTGDEGRRHDPAGEPPLNLARRELQTGLSAPMRDLLNRDAGAFADAMDMSFRLAPRRSPHS